MSIWSKPPGSYFSLFKVGSLLTDKSPTLVSPSLQSPTQGQSNTGVPVLS